MTTQIIAAYAITAASKYPKAIVTGEMVSPNLWAGTAYWEYTKVIGTISVFKKDGKLQCHSGKLMTIEEHEANWK